MSIDIEKYSSKHKPTWCPGCGNFGISMALKKALSELNISPTETFISFDIGCNGNGADTFGTYGFKGLHGRSIALATGVHLANRKFTTIVELGDGACFHEGIDHLINAIRSNYDITVLIHNNRNFALTTGQATIGTPKGKSMYALPYGKPEKDYNTDELILSLHPTFYAKGYSGDLVELTDIIKKGIKHKGCSIIDIAQLCPSYNKECTPEWFSKHIVKISTLKKYSETSFEDAHNLVQKMIKEEKIYTGIIYQDKNTKTFYDNLHNRKSSTKELVEEVKEFNIKNLLKTFE
ncbi:MAG: thiamine pyrophosphate-dependent enzyme [Candidatus Dojkabacteria bacterium]|jgi:2-oxoglutarate ferredoxin oxidoreductase subunit beta